MEGREDVDGTWTSKYDPRTYWSCRSHPYIYGRIERGQSFSNNKNMRPFSAFFRTSRSFNETRWTPTVSFCLP